MFTVGLTGGIAAGKTTLSNLFAGLGAPVVDTDLISRELLEPGEPGYEQVCDHFGDSIIDANNEIDRAKLRQIVFSNADEKTWLESMLHPLIYRCSHNAILEHAEADYVLVVIPLLFESNFQALVDRILVVDCPAELQLERLLKRDHMDETLALKMLAQQLSNSERLARAHDIVDNSENGADLGAQVEALHQLYLQLSSGQSDD
jgi:dephospho-CoA kinase